MQSRQFVLLILVAPLLLCGCNPGIKVRKNPADCDTGIRYYRPKPYLVVKPSGLSIVAGKVTTTRPSDEFVELSLEYLPDFAEEYAINVRPGLGSANVQITLDQGWNLTQINQELDSQFDENIQAVADLVRAGGSLIPSAVKGPEVGVPRTQKWVVQATNVPIGYYEAVIGMDQGKKRHYGWRYVGFAPFNSCPTDMCGYETAHCNDYNAAIFGLVFECGVMQFKPLNTIHETRCADRCLVNAGEVQIPAGGVAATGDTGEASMAKEIALSIVNQTIWGEKVAPEDLLVTPTSDGLGH